MKFKNKGRKIYKTKEKNYYGKSPFGKFMSGALTVLLIGGIGFLGYSAAEPIINYTKHKGDEPSVPEQTTAPTEIGTEAVTTAMTEAVTEPPTEPVTESSYTAASLKGSDLANIDTLRAALAALPKNEEITYIQLPLKTAGGDVNYASYIAEAQNSLTSVLTLQEIITEVENSGYKPTAVVSIFRDNSMPAYYHDGGYVFASDGTLWYDGQGKPWASPYAQRAIDYNSAIVTELVNAGFERIICSDFVFPDFTEYDLQILDPILGKNDRCMSMTSTANLLYSIAVSNGSEMQVEVTAEDIICGRKDILQPMLLSSNNIVLNIEINKLVSGIQTGETLYEFKGKPSEMVDQCLMQVNGDIVDFNTTVRISGASLPTAELTSIKKILSDYGFKSVVIG